MYKKEKNWKVSYEKWRNWFERHETLYVVSVLAWFWRTLSHKFTVHRHRFRGRCGKMSHGLKLSRWCRWCALEERSSTLKQRQVLVYARCCKGREYIYAVPFILYNASHTAASHVKWRVDESLHCHGINHSLSPLIVLHQIRLFQLSHSAALLHT